MTERNKIQTKSREWIPRTYKISKHNREVAKRLTELELNNQHDDDYLAVIFSTMAVSNPKTPRTFKSTYNLPEDEKQKWLDTVRSEFENFLQRKSWIKTKRSDVPEARRKPLDVKHVFKMKD